MALGQFIVQFNGFVRRLLGKGQIVSRRRSQSMQRVRICQASIGSGITGVLLDGLVQVLNGFVETLEAPLLLEQAEPRGLRQSHRSEEHTSELQSRSDIVCRLLLEKKNRYM